MRNMIAGIVAIVFSLVCGISFAASDLKKIEQSFSRGTFIIDVPSGYDDTHKQSQNGAEAFGFATAPRMDGTRGMIQVSVLDLRVIFQSEELKTIEIEYILSQMLDGVKKRRLSWEESEISYTTLNGVRFARVEWSGNAVLNVGATPMKGIMYAGKVGDIAFVLHTQDIAPYYDKTLPLCERSLRTFRVMN